MNNDEMLGMYRLLNLLNPYPKVVAHFIVLKIDTQVQIWHIYSSGPVLQDVLDQHLRHLLVS